MRSRAIGWLVLAVAALGVVAGGACRRRARNGACAAHIDCDPGYDCREGLCVKRPPVPGSEAARVTRRPVEAPAPAEAPAPSEPMRQREAPAPTPKAPRPTPPANYAPPLDPTLPMWKARLKNS